MQTNRKTRPSPVQAPNIKKPYSAGKYRKEDNRLTLVVLSVLCLVLPPVGALLTWRAKKLELTIRGALTTTALLSCTFIFCLLMRSGTTLPDIRPVPATPQTIGHNASVAVYATEVPAPPAAVPAIPSATDAPAVQESGELTDDTIVYAVTNNAASYHLYEVCGQQENRRALTLREALNEGLAPCENCVGAMG